MLISKHFVCFSGIFEDGKFAELKWIGNLKNFWNFEKKWLEVTNALTQHTFQNYPKNL
jgi:hypothetical protein